MDVEPAMIRWGEGSLNANEEIGWTVRGALGVAACRPPWTGYLMSLLNASSKGSLMAPIAAEKPLGCVVERAYANHADI